MNEEVMMMNETEALMQESGATAETNEAEEAGTGETQDEALEAVKAGVARLYEDGWSAEELTALSQDEGARRDIARGIGVERTAPVERLEARVSAHETHLNALENRSRTQSEELKLLLRGQMAMLRHMLGGGDETKLAACCEAIESFLTDR